MIPVWVFSLLYFVGGLCLLLWFMAIMRGKVINNLGIRNPRIDYYFGWVSFMIGISILGIATCLVFAPPGRLTFFLSIIAFPLCFPIAAVLFKLFKNHPVLGVKEELYARNIAKKKR